MSLNTAHAPGGVLIYSTETILLYCDEVVIEFSGQSDPIFKGKKVGLLYLTTHRLIFNNDKKNDPMISFSFPFSTLSDLDVEQPMFGANFIRGKVRAQPDGNWVGEAKFKITFKKGGAIDFGTALLKAASLAQRFQNNDSPPPYFPPQTPWYQAPPPAYTPPQGGYYGWNPPTHAFPLNPQANSVFMTDMPPPYPGIGGFSQSYAPAQGFNQPPTAPTAQGGYPPQNPPPPGFAPGNNQTSQSSADAKAAEAAQNAYYDPNQPQCAYVPPPPSYFDIHPTQTDNNKKNQ